VRDVKKDEGKEGNERKSKRQWWPTAIKMGSILKWS